MRPVNLYRFHPLSQMLADFVANGINQEMFSADLSGFIFHLSEHISGLCIILMPFYLFPLRDREPLAQR